MTIKEAQELVEAWEYKNHTHENSELTNESTQKNNRTSNELSQIFWDILHIANIEKIDLTSALIDNLEQKEDKL